MIKKLLFVGLLLFQVSFGINAQVVAPVQVNCMAFTPDGKKMITGGDSGLVQIWNHQGKLIKAFKIEALDYGGPNPSKVVVIAISPDGKKIAAKLSDGNIYFYNSDGLFLNKVSRYCQYLFFTDNGNTIISIGENFYKYTFDSEGKEKGNFGFWPEESSLKNNPTLSDAAMLPNGNMLMVYNIWKKNKDYHAYYDYYLAEYSKNNELVRKLQIEINPMTWPLKLSLSNDYKKALLFGTNSGDLTGDGFLYFIPAGALEKMMQNKYNSNKTVRTSSDGLGFISQMEKKFTFTPDEQAYMALGRSDITYYSKNMDILKKDKIPVSPDYCEQMLLSPDRQTIFYIYKDKLPEAYSLQGEKLFTFDNSVTVDDSYVYVVPVKVSRVDPNFVYLDELVVDFTKYSWKDPYRLWTGREWETPRVIVDVYNNEGIYRRKSFIEMANPVFDASISFDLTGKPSEGETYAGLTFWVREDPSDTKGNWEIYEARVYNDGYLKLVRWKNGKDKVIDYKMANGTALIYTLRVWTDTEGKVSLMVYDYGENSTNNIINSGFTANTGNVSEDPFWLGLCSMGCATFRDLTIKGKNIIKTDKKIEKQAVSQNEKPGETNLEEMIRASIGLGMLDEALILLNDKLRENPDMVKDPGFISLMALVLANKKDFSSVGPLINKAVELCTTTESIDKVRKITLEIGYLSGDYQGVLEASDKVQSKFPDDPNVWFFLGASKYFTNQFADAIPDLEKAVAKKENDKLFLYEMDAVYFLTVCATETKRWDLSEIYLKKIIPAVSDTNKKADLTAQLSEAFFNLKKYDSTIVYAEKAILMKIENTNAYALLAQSYIKIGNQNKANDIMNSLLASYPADPEAMCHYGLYMLDQKNFVKASEYFDKAILLDPTNPKFPGAASMAMDEAKNYPKAIEFALKSVMLQPGNSWINYNLGYLYAKNKEFDKAIDWENKTLAIDSLYFMAISVKAWANLEKGMFDKALEFAFKSILISQKANKVFDMPYYYAAVCYDKKGEKDRAAGFYKTAAAIGNSEAQEILKKSGSAWGKWDEAGKAYFAKANSLFASKNYAEAIKNIKLALELMPCETNFLSLKLKITTESGLK